MPKRSVSSDRVYKSRLPFAQATIASDFMFVCCAGADLQGQSALGDARRPAVHRQADGSVHEFRHANRQGFRGRSRQPEARHRITA